MEIPYKWSGGKRNEVKYFKKYYPNSFSTFIEPFFGAGAVYFDLEFSNNVINDIHPESINFLTQLQNGSNKELYDLMASVKNTEEDYDFIRDKYEPENGLQKAFRFFFLRKTCFRGMLKYNSKGKFNIPFGRYKTYKFEELLNPGYTDLLKRTKIYNGDYNLIFDEYDAPNSFVF
jgi:DNA adenine methylase